MSDPAARGTVWLGELVECIGALAPDEDTLAEIARSLGLARPPPRRTGGAAKPPSAPAGTTTSAGADTGTPAEPPLAAEPDTGAPSHRLPLNLNELPRAADGAAVDDAPAWLAKQPPLHEVDRFTPPRPAPSLLPRRSRRALLARLLATLVPEGAPDMRRIVAHVARARPLLRVPRLSRPTLRHGAELRCDRAPWLEPFHADHDDLIAAVAGLMPAERLRVWSICGTPEPDPGDEAALRRDGRPGPSAPVLVASDLGAAYEPLGHDAAPPSQWAAFVARHRRQGRRVVALAPVANAGNARPKDVALMPWAESSTLTHARRALAGQGRWPRPAEAVQVGALAAQLSVAQQASPWLVRSARQALGLAPPVEQALWFSPLVQSRGIEGLVLAPEAAWALRAKLDVAQRGAALALHRQQRDPEAAPDGLAIEDDLIALELGGVLDAGNVEQVLRPALKSLADRDRAVALWAAHAWGRFSPALREQPAARQLAFAASALLSSGAWLIDGQGRTPGLPLDLGWMLAQAGGRREKVSVQLRHYADDTINLVVGPPQPKTTALDVIELPATRPLWLEVVPRDPSGQAWRQTVQLQPGDTVQFAAPSSLLESGIDLRGLDGRHWTLDSTRDGSRAVAGAFLNWVGLGLRRPKLVAGGAVAYTDSFAIMPVRGLSAEQWKSVVPGTRIDLLRGDRSGKGMAEVVSVIGQATAAIECLVLRREPGTPPWVPLDPQMRLLPWAPAGEAPEWARFVTLTKERSDTSDLIVNEDWPDRPRSPSGTLPPEGPQLVAPVRSGAWHLAWVAASGGAAAEPSMSPVDAATEPAISLLEWSQAVRQAQVASAQTPPRRWLLLATPDQRDTAQIVWDALVSRLGSDRVAHDHDGRVFASLEADTAPVPGGSVLRGIDALLLLCGEAAPEGWPELVESAVRSDMPILWVASGGLATPLRHAPPALWPQALWRSVSRRPAAAVDLRALASADSEAIGQLLAQMEAGVSRVGVGSGAGDTPPTATTEPVSPAGQAATRFSLRGQLALALDKRSEAEIGLFRVVRRAGGVDLVRATWPRSGAPALLLVHGEAADTLPDFAGLLERADADSARLFESHSDQVYAWRWRSITLAPLANAQRLAAALGGGVAAHVLSLGAGGLLPELLALAAAHAGTPDPISAERLAAWRSKADAGVVAAFDSLIATVRKAAPSVARFVRVAAPMQGTDLFDGGVRRALGPLEAVLPAVASLAIRWAGIDRLLSDPEVTPGLHALKPDAGVLPLLDTPTTTSMPLAIVAGSQVSDGIGSWLASNLASWVMAARGQRHDLVVPLPSAFGGLERSGGVAWLLDQGSHVSHFKYMVNPGTRAAIIDALVDARWPPPHFQLAPSLFDLQLRFSYSENAIRHVRP